MGFPLGITTGRQARVAATPPGRPAACVGANWARLVVPAQESKLQEPAQSSRTLQRNASVSRTEEARQAGPRSEPLAGETSGLRRSLSARRPIEPIGAEVRSV